MPNDLSAEEVYSDDRDPIDAIAEIRREQEKSESLQDESPAPIEGNNEPSAEDQGAVVEDVEDPAPSVEGEIEDQDIVEGEAEEVPDKESGELETPEPEPKQNIKTIKANGQEFQFTEAEMIEQFQTVFGKAMDYSKKTQSIAPYRKMISALEQEGITSDQLNVAIDALKGDKGALAKLVEINEVDPFDLADEDTQKNYAPKEYGKDETLLNIEEVVARIQDDKEYPITVNVIEKQWDSQSRQVFAEDPRLIEEFHSHIKSGRYDKVAPAAMKMKVLDGSVKSDLEYYIIADSQLQQQENQNQQQAAVSKLNEGVQNAGQKFDQASSEASSKRAVASTRKRADVKSDVINYLDDDGYDEWYEKVMSKV